MTSPSLAQRKVLAESGAAAMARAAMSTAARIGSRMGTNSLLSALGAERGLERHHAGGARNVEDGRDFSRTAPRWQRESRSAAGARSPEPGARRALDEAEGEPAAEDDARVDERQGHEVGPRGAEARHQK